MNTNQWELVSIIDEALKMFSKITYHNIHDVIARFRSQAWTEVWASNYKELTLFRQWEEQALAANSQKNLPAKKDLKILLCFYDTYIIIIIIIKYYLLCSGSPAPLMSITLENEADIIVWTLGTLLISFEQRQYLFGG